MLKPPILTSSSAIERLLQERVAPWVERLPWQAATPLRYDESEGYKGQGVVGCRAGPLDSIGFEHLAHELAHAFEILESKGPGALGQPQWGMRIRTRVRVGSQVFWLCMRCVWVFSDFTCIHRWWGEACRCPARW